MPQLALSENQPIAAMLTHSLPTQSHRSLPHETQNCNRIIPRSLKDCPADDLYPHHDTSSHDQLTNLESCPSCSPSYAQLPAAPPSAPSPAPRP